MFRKILHSILPFALAAVLCGSALAVSAHLPGDVNRNGKVTAFDALLIQAHLHEEIMLDDEQIEIAIRSKPEVTTLSSAHIMATLFTPMMGEKQSKILPSEDGRYHISEPSQLIWLQTFPNASFVLEQDIDMAGASWTPTSFSGTLDGNGCCIRNLHTAAATGKNLGVLFTSAGKNALIKNLALFDCTLEPNDKTENIGILCGTNEGTVVNCGASNILCGGQPLPTDDTVTTELFLSDGDAVRGVTYRNPVAVRCTGGSVTFRDCSFTQGLTVLRAQDSSFRVTLTDCETNGAITTAESDLLNDPAADGAVTLFVPNGTAVCAQAHTFVQAAPGSVFTLNGLTLTGTPGMAPNGSFEAEYRFGRKDDLSLSASIRLHTAADAQFTASGALTDNLIVLGNAVLTQVEPGSFGIGLSCGDNVRIRCALGDVYAQILMAGSYDLTGTSCGKLLFGEGALIYWNESDTPLPQFATWPDYNNMDKAAQKTYYNAFPTKEDFDSWKTEAQNGSAVHPVIFDGSEMDLGK